MKGTLGSLMHLGGSSAQRGKGVLRAVDRAGLLDAGRKGEMCGGKYGDRALGSGTRQDDTGRWEKSSVLINVGVEKRSGREGHDPANQECRGHELGSLSIPKSSKTSPKERVHDHLSGERSDAH